jgi:hypothetical protein
MTLKLRAGARLSLDIQQDEHGFILTPVSRVGSTTTPRGKAKRCKTEEQLWATIEIFAQDQLAQLGLAKIKA